MPFSSDVPSLVNAKVTWYQHVQLLPWAGLPSFPSANFIPFRNIQKYSAPSLPQTTWSASMRLKKFGVKFFDNRLLGLQNLEQNEMFVYVCICVSCDVSVSVLALVLRFTPVRFRLVRFVSSAAAAAAWHLYCSDITGLHFSVEITQISTRV